MRDEFPRACPAPDDSQDPAPAPGRSLCAAAEELLWIAEQAGLDAPARAELRTAMVDWSRRFARRTVVDDPPPETEEAGLVALTVDRLRRLLRG